MAKGTDLVRKAGSVGKAAESLWEVREDRQLMNLAGVEDNALDEILHPDHLAYLRDVRREGMSARYVGNRDRVKARLHPNARRNVDQVYKQLAKDTKKHRVLVVDGASRSDDQFRQADCPGPEDGQYGYVEVLASTSPSTSSLTGGKEDHLGKAPGTRSACPHGQEGHCRGVSPFVGRSG